MKCPVCGGELREGASFCTYCGTRISTAPFTAPASAPVPPQKTARPQLQMPANVPQALTPAPQLNIQPRRHRSVLCPSCGSLQSSSQEVCNNCGMPLGQAIASADAASAAAAAAPVQAPRVKTVVCPVCGSIERVTNPACTNCGTPITAQMIAAAQAEADRRYAAKQTRAHRQPIAQHSSTPQRTPAAVSSGVHTITRIASFLLALMLALTFISASCSILVSHTIGVVINNRSIMTQTNSLLRQYGINLSNGLSSGVMYRGIISFATGDFNALKKVVLDVMNNGSSNSYYSGYDINSMISAQWDMQVVPQLRTVLDQGRSDTRFLLVCIGCWFARLLWLFLICSILLLAAVLVFKFVLRAPMRDVLNPLSIVIAGLGLFLALALLIGGILFVNSQMARGSIGFS